MLPIQTAAWSATALAVTGVWLNNRRRRVCFLVWLFSNTISLAVHAVAGVWPLVVRDAAFLVLSVHGWWLWRARSHRPRM
jgi:nicotinamide riboside transporter PnuC